MLTAAVLTPRSRGTVRLRTPTPDAPPLIDHAFLSDPDGEDLALLTEAFEQARAVAEQPDLAALLGRETHPGAAVRPAADVAAGLGRAVSDAHHTVGTCKMGPESDPRR